jgi:serine/threonine-protein kinase
VVYQVSQASRHLALKIGNDSFALTSEVNVLKLFQKAQGSVLGPSLYDVDDWESPDGIRSFYVMNVVDGVPMHRYVREKGAEWMPVLVMQLLGFLAHLHDKGYVFGDLKPEHLLVTGHPPRLSWFDAGGAGRLKNIRNFMTGGIGKWGTARRRPNMICLARR